MIDKNKLSFVLLVLGTILIITSIGYSSGHFPKEIMFLAYCTGLITFSIRSIILNKK